MTTTPVVVAAETIGTTVGPATRMIAKPARRTLTKSRCRSPAQVPEGAVEIRIVSDDAGGFVPGELTVDLGQTVAFVNAHHDEHTATGSGFDTGVIASGRRRDGRARHCRQICLCLPDSSRDDR